MFSTEFNRQTLEHRTGEAHASTRAHQHRLMLRESSHPPSRPKAAPRRGLAIVLARAARRLDGETARRAVA